MKPLRQILKSLGALYVEGFKGMTWGRTMWILILLKLFILFAILRLFFFKPVLAGKTDTEKSDFVGTMLTSPDRSDTNTITITKKP